MNRRSFFSRTIGAALTGVFAVLSANKATPKISNMFWRVNRSFTIEGYSSTDGIRSLVVSTRDFSYYDPNKRRLVKLT